MIKNLLFSPLLFLSVLITSCDFNESNEISGENDGFDLAALEAERTIAPDRIYFNKPTLSVVVGKKTKLDVSFLPKNTTNKELTYTISDPSFCSISDDGYLLATKCGKFQVTAFAAQSDVYATCDIHAGSGPINSIITEEEINLDLNANSEQEITYKTEPEDAFQDIKFDDGDSDIASIIDNKVIGKQTGKTEVFIYDDANHNSRREENEKYISVDVNVHDVSEFTNRVEPTHSTNGEIVYKCKCGCEKERHEVIPALSHNFGDAFFYDAPTCTESGLSKKECEGCGFILEETLPALGHNHVEEVKDENVAKLGDIISKTEYYYTCDRCNQLIDETFQHGHHDDFYTQRIPECFDEPEKADNYKTAVVRTLNKFEEYKEKAFEKHIYINYKNLGVKFGSCTHIVKLAASARGTYPWVHSNAGNWTTSVSNGAYAGLYVTSANNYNTDVEKRKNDMVYFDNIHAETDKLIRKDATDVEKALIILLYTAKFITYKSIFFFYTTAATGEGLCHCYAYMVSHLAHRYNLPCIYDGGNEHAWNNVCIDGTWYLLDATWSDTHLKYFCREKNPSKTHTVNNTTTLVKTDSSLRNKLVQLYKNGEMAGIYYDVDTALEQINDSDADYKLVLGIGTDGVLGLTLSSGYYYYLNNYTTSKTSLNCKSLSIEKCKTTDSVIPVFHAPASLLNQSNISFKTVNISVN